MNALEFLQWLSPAGPWQVCCFDPDGGPSVTKVFHKGSEHQLAAFINRVNGRLNVYYSINCPGAPKDRKPTKAEIDCVRWLQADLDCRKDHDRAAERQRILQMVMNELPAKVLKPSAIVDSGNGYQLLWRIKPTTDVALAEMMSEWLGDQLGGDKVSNVDRVFRLPGTLNIPTASKKAAGYDVVPAKVVALNGLCYDLAELCAPRADDAFLSTADVGLKKVERRDIALYDEWDIGRLMDEVGGLPAQWLDEYELWLKLGMIIHHVTQGGEDGLQLWDLLSGYGRAYQLGACARRWPSFDRYGGPRVGVGTLVMAIKDAERGVELIKDRVAKDQAA